MIRGIHVLVGVVCLAAVGVLTRLDWASLNLPLPEATGLLVLVGLGLLSEYEALSIEVTTNRGTSTVTFLPCLAVLLLFGTTIAVLYVLFMGCVGDFGFRKKDPLRATFNTAQYGLSMFLAGHVFEWADGIPQALQAAFQVQALPFAIAAITFLGANQVFVSLAITVNESHPFGKVFRTLVSRSGTNLLYDLLISPIAVCLAYVFVEIGIPGLLIASLPMMFIRHSYLVNLSHQRTNRALMMALVKAIETRDPYTSGHSLRVASLSKRIAAGMGVTGSKLEAIETAALLHDIGKIEAIYNDILKKPDKLSDDERRTIESHVTKGVELLNSLASFPREVIEAVRYHHEREDGRGYPAGISGSQIPLGARIIKVVDAIDAMLSDRPYRSALTLEQVKDELVAHAGTQFNEAVVDVVLKSSVLEEHAIELLAVRSEIDPGALRVRDGAPDRPAPCAPVGA